MQPVIITETISRPIADSVPIAILQRYKADDFKILEITRIPLRGLVIVHVNETIEGEQDIQPDIADFWKPTCSLLISCLEVLEPPGP